MDAWGERGKRYGRGGFSNVVDIVYDSHNNMYTLESMKYFKRVQKFSKSNKFIRQWGSVGTGAGQFGGGSEYSTRMAINSADEIYVFDGKNKRIQRFNSNGKLLQIIDISKDIYSGIFAGGDIAIDKNNNVYYLANYTYGSVQSKVHVYNRYGKKLRDFIIKYNDDNYYQSDKYLSSITIDKKRNFFY